MYRETIRGIQADVFPKFVPESSRPDDGYNFFAYTIGPSSHEDRPAQLLKTGEPFEARIPLFFLRDLGEAST